MNQNNFPYLWLLFQNLVGGNADKKRLILKNFQEEQKVLEVGCSVGNIAEAFRSVRNISYQGIDIDCQAVAAAQWRFSISFVCEDLTQFSRKKTTQFGLIYFAGILHYVADGEV